jgi:hypothetical protein
MKHPVEVLRLFSKPDEEMLQQSDACLSSFREYKSPFIEQFPQLADPFDTEWEAATATARQILPDYAAVAGQSSETDKLEALMEQGRNLFQTIILYVQLAFPKDATMLNLFGQSQYDSSRNNHLKLPVLLRSTFKMASQPDYKEALMAKGLKESQIALLNDLADSITNQTLVQQDAKNDRSLAGSQRIAAMNAVWERMSLVCQCAKLVFQDDVAKYNLFLLTDGESQKTVEPTTVPVGN